MPASGPGIAPFSVSSNGVLAYWPTPPGDATTLRWYDRNGKATDAIGSPARYSGLDLTPDGRRLVMARWDENGRRDIWVRDLASGVESKLTTDGDSMWPQWPPDGQRIAFGSAREDKAPNLYTRAVTGGKDDRITDIDIAVPASWSADGKIIVFEANDAQTSNNLRYLRLEDRKPQKLPFNTAATEFGGRLSPDGQWLAYVTGKSGRNEVWLARFPSAEQKWQISISGGSQPEWRGDGEELFYISNRHRMMAIPIGKAATTLTIGKPAELFSIPEFVAHVNKDSYAPTPDGRRFLVSVRAENPLDPPLHVILNWPKLVEKK